MASIGQLLQLAGGMPSRVSSSDNAVLTGDLSGLGTISSVALSASGAISGGSLSVSGSSVLADVSAASLAVSGNGSFGGTLSVTGASSLSSLSASGNGSFGGTLAVAGASTLHAVSATNIAASGTLSVVGASTLADLSAQAISAASLSLSGALDVGGASVLHALSAGATDLSSLSVSGASSLHALSAGATDLSSLAVSGASVLHALSAGASDLSSLAVSGASVLHALSAGATDLSSLDVSGASNFAGVTAGATSLASLDVSGASNLAALSAGATDLASLQVDGASQFIGAMNASDINASGDLYVAGAFEVVGAAEMANIDAQAIHAASLAADGNISAGGNFSVAGSSSFTGVLTAGDIDADTIDTTGAVAVGGAFSAAGDASFAQNVNIAGNLSVQGTTTSRVSEDVLLADRFITQNYTLTNPAAGKTTAGGAYIVEALDQQFTLLSVNGASGVEKFYVSADPAGKIAAGDVITSAGSLQPKNSGLFQVKMIGSDATGYFVQVESPAAAGPLDGVVNTALLETEASAPAGSYLSHVAIQVIRADGNGEFSLGYGNSASSMAFDKITPATAITLQQAYNNGHEIATTGAKGNVKISGTEAFEVSAMGGIVANKAQFSATLDVAGASTFAAVSAASAAVSGNASIGGTLAVTGASTIASLSATSGSFSGALSAASAAISGNETIGGTLAVTGASTFASVSATSAAFSGAVTMAQTLAVTGVFSASANASVGADLSVAGLTHLTGALDGSSASFSADIAAVNADFSGDLSAINADFSADLSAVNADFSGHVVAADMKADAYGVPATASGAIAAGDIVCLNGGLHMVKKALADDAVNAREWRAWGIARDAIANAAQGYIAVDGFIAVNFESAQSGVAGDPVYLSAASAGKATLVAPNAAGNAICQIGYLAQDMSSASSAQIGIAKQFIAMIPA